MWKAYFWFLGFFFSVLALIALGGSGLMAPLAIAALANLNPTNMADAFILVIFFVASYVLIVWGWLRLLDFTVNRMLRSAPE